MHQPASEPRASLYYSYQVFEPWLPSQNPPQDRKTVVIMGAGPAGLTAALELARYGVASVVLESERQVSEGSRAIVFTRRTMEILQQVGVAQTVTDAGLPWCYGNSYYRNQRVFRMENERSKDDRFFPMINLQQQYLEEYLVEAVKASPLIELRWGNRVQDLQQQTDYVGLTIETPEGSYTLETDWLIASDGARSLARSCLDLKMEGASYKGRFVIADIRIDLPYPTERLAFFDPPWNPGNTVLMHREPQGMWRVDYQLPADESPEDALQPQALHTRIQALLKQIGHDDKPWELDWSSVYSAHALSLPHYVHGRVLFTGDAAHLLPIFGVRGANTAFQDSQSLGWHLAFVVKGLASKAFLDNYSQERVKAAFEIVEEAGKSTRFMAPPSPGFRLLRDAVLSLSLSQEFVRPLYHWRTSHPHEYQDSVLNCSGDDTALFKTGPGHGAPPKNIFLSDNNYLLDHLGGGFDLLYFCSHDTLPAWLVKQLGIIRERGLPIRLIAINPNQRVNEADLSLIDTHGRVRAAYGVQADGAAYLLRPDQHICGRWVTLDEVRLSDALNQLLNQ